MDLLMRHSSPLVVRSGATSPAAERNSSPSPLRLSRPRSNPRNRTPMRYESPLNADAFRLREEDEEEAPATNEGRRITIRPMVGSAVGFTMATPRVSIIAIAGIYFLSVLSICVDSNSSCFRFEKSRNSNESQLQKAASKDHLIEKFVDGTTRTLLAWRLRSTVPENKPPRCSSWAKPMLPNIVQFSIPMHTKAKYWPNLWMTRR